MSAPEGNKYNEIYTLEKELPIFQEIIERAKEGEFLSIQEAVMKAPYSRQIFYYLCDRFKDLDIIKEELNDVIVAIVNRNALEGTYNATASIWRMKQLGERDEKYQDVTSNGKDIVQSIEPITWKNKKDD